MSTIVTRSGKGSPLTNTEVDSNFTNLNTGKAELSGAVFTGAITTNSTIDGRDVAADGATADAALPKSGGAMTGAITTNSTFDGVDIATRDAVLTSTTTTANAALPKAGGAMTGAITTNSTFDGRDVATDGTKLDGIEASADVTDTANVTAAGALMDSELTAIASVKALNQGVATGDSPTFVDVTATSLDISGNIDVDGTTNLDVVDIDGAVDMASTLAVGGRVTAAGVTTSAALISTSNSNTLGNTTISALIVDNFTIDGTTIALTSGNLTLDVAGDIILDADGGDITFNDGGTTIGQIRNQSSDLVFQSSVSDKDIKFVGNDGGSDVTALTLDMSEGGNATFNQHAYFGDNGYIVLGAGEDVKIHSDGTNGTIAAPNGNLTLDVAGDIILDADGGDLILKDGGTEFMAFYNGTIGRTGDLTLDASGDIILDADGGDVIFKDGGTEFGRVFGSSNNFYIQARQSDKDMIFQGIDGGSAITALTLDMSAAGAATFNSTVTSTAYGSQLATTSFVQNAITTTVGSSSGAFIRMAVSNAGNPTYAFDGDTDTGMFTSGSNTLNFSTASTERARLDSDGRFIVGATSAFNSSSFCVDQSGLGQFRRDGTPLIVRRDGSVGGLIDLEDDGTSVGQIGTEGGDSTYIQGGTSSGSGLHFHGTSGDITPSRNGGRIDNAIDLGSTANRFRDLQLSGGVYLGGTGAANKLSDVETGTWSPALRGDGSWSAGTQGYSVRTGNYVKVGSFVYLAFDVQVNGLGTVAGNYLQIGNFPFSVDSSNLGGGNVSYYSGVSNTSGPLLLYAASTQGYLMEGAALYVALSDATASTRIIGTIMYKTAQ